jgi:hypothetical protein
MKTVARGSYAARRRVSLMSAVPVVALVVFLSWGIASQASRDDNRVRPAASEAGRIEVYGANPRGRAHAYHSTSRTRCLKTIMLPKRGKACVEVRQRGRGSRRE